MTAFMNDQAVVDRVLSHVRDGTTDRGEEVWREPVENYRSKERLRKEIELLRRSTIPFCPSAALPEPGSYIARNAAGIPIVAVRGQDGIVRAFKNACRHRGAEVAQGSGCAKAFVCPYHGWAYGLDGQLKNMPHEDGFPGVNADKHGLEPVYAEERSGLVLVNQSGEPNEHDTMAGLDDLIAPGQDLIDTHFTHAKTNWKVSLEGSIEGLHIRFGHNKSFYPYGYDNLNVIETYGRNSRVTFPFRRIEKQAKLPVSERQAEGRLTYIYHLFPNALVATLSHHTDLIVLEPLETGETMMVAYTVANTGGDPEAMAAAKRDAEFVNSQGAPEDLELVESVQRSIDSGANEFFTFGHFESAIIHFYRYLNSELEETETSAQDAQARSRIESLEI